MRIGIRADGGQGAGMGHLGRCMALAEAFAHLGERPVFLDVPAACRPWVARRGFPMRRWGASRWDLLIADSYRFSRRDASDMRRASGALLVFDDLGTYAGPCDWLLNGHAYAQALRFHAPGGTTLMLGPKFLPLRREYWEAAPRRAVRPAVGRVLVSLGGDGAGPAARSVMRAAEETWPRAEVHLVLGPLAALPAWAAGSRVRRLPAPPSLRPHILAADVGISGGGQTLYEFARCGTPAAAVTLADNQSLNVGALAGLGAAVSAGRAGASGFAAALRRCLRALAPAGRRARMAAAGRGLTDGRGALRVAAALLAGRAA